MTHYQLDLAQAAEPAGDDFFDSWEFAPAAAGLSFAAGAQAEPSSPTWQIALPGQQDEAQELLGAQQGALRRTMRRLDAAEQRLDQVEPGLSFSSTAGPEAELQAAIFALTPGPGISFSAAEVEERQGIAGRWHAFAAQVNQLLTQYATVETKVSERIIGRTAVGWTGDFKTEVIATANRKTAELHKQAVQLALATRTAMLRLLIVISTGAAKLALRLAVPGAQILLLPAIYKFVRDVLKEMRPLRTAIQQ